MTIGGIKAMAKYNWDKFGFHIPEIMVPKVGTDYSKWAVVAWRGIYQYQRQKLGKCRRNRW